MKKLALLLLSLILMFAATGCELSSDVLVPESEEFTYDEIDVGFEAAEDSVISGTYNLIMTSANNYQSEHTAFIVQNGSDIVLCFSTSADKTLFKGTYHPETGEAEMHGTSDPEIVYLITFYPDETPVSGKGEVSRDGGDYCNIAMTKQA